MRLSALAVAVSLALGAGLLTGCDRTDGDRAVSKTTPGSGASSSSGPSTTPGSPSGSMSGSASTPSAPPSSSGGSTSADSGSSPDTEKKQ